MTPVNEPFSRVQVTARNVATAYLSAEFTRITGNSDFTFHEEKHIKNLPDDEFWRLVQGLSSTYRLNCVSEYLGNTRYVWYSEPRSAHELEMPKMSLAIDRVTHSPEIGRDMLKFRDYLQRYFREHPDNDPEGLDQFRLKRLKELSRYEQIILKYRDGRLVVDGNNRLMRFLLEGNNSFEAFTGYPEGEPALMATWSEFRTLRNLWRTAEKPAERQYILMKVGRLMESTHDGRKAVEVIWVTYGRFPEVIAAGKSLLED